jgi:SAM-dependent methyltransferase
MPGFADHFSAHADAYAAHRPRYPSALVDFLAELAPRTGLAWEAGCGSGQLSVALAARFGRVIATDASAAQLARATEHRRVDYRLARAEDSGLPAAPSGAAAGAGEAAGGVDLAVAAQAAHWFEIDGYYAEVRRVAAPDGAIALVSYGPTLISPDIDPIVEGFRVGTLAPFWAPERRHVEDGYRSLPFPFDEVEPLELAMRVEWTLSDMLAYMRTWSALRSMEEPRRKALLEDLREALGPAWAEATEAGNAVTDGPRRTVSWPLSVRAGYV